MFLFVLIPFFPLQVGWCYWMLVGGIESNHKSVATKVAPPLRQRIKDSISFSQLNFNKKNPYLHSNGPHLSSEYDQNS